MLDVHHRFIRHLEQVARLDRALEALPDAETVEERRAAGRGLTRPELAVLLAYSKITVYAALLDSDLPEDPYLSTDLARVLPLPRCPSASPTRWRATGCGARSSPRTSTNTMVDRAGSTFAFRMEEETGATAADIARAYAVAREVFEMPAFWRDVDALDNVVAGRRLQTEMLLDARKLIERATRWLLRNRRRPLDIAATVDRLHAAARGASPSALPGVLVDADREAWDERVAELTEAGVPGRARRARRRASARCSRRSTSSRSPREPERDDRARSPRCTSASARGCGCTGCATASPSCRATTAGRRWPAPRCATTCSTLHRARHRRRAARERRPPGTRRRSASTRGWRATARRSTARSGSSTTSAPAARTT